MQRLSQSANQYSLICSHHLFISKANKLEVVASSSSKIHKCIQSLEYGFYK